MLGPVGLGQDDDAARDRRLRAGRLRARAAARRRRHRQPAVRAPAEHGLPGLRAVPAHERRRERRLRPARQGRRQARAPQRAAEALAMVRLPDVGERRPIQLSGGQRQRVALARALVNRPRVLLLDEPLGALDLKLRQEMQVELKSIQRELSERITFIYVTHDQDEALTMSDRIAVFSDGRIEQVGTPGEIYERPANEFVASFVGTSNVIQRDGRVYTVRPEKIRLLRDGESDPGAVAGTVREVAYLGPVTRYDVESDDGETIVVLEQNLDNVGGASAGEAGKAREDRLEAAGRFGAAHKPRGGTEQMRLAKIDWVLGVVLAAMVVAVSACGSSSSSSSSAGLPTKIGTGEGQLNLVAWEGYAARMGQALRSADGLQGARQVRGLLRRNGHADAPGRRRPVRHGLGLRRREPAPDPRRRGRADERRAGARMEELHPAAAVARRTTPSTASTTASRCSGARTRCSTTRKSVTPGADELVGDLQPEVQGPGHRARPTRSRSPTRRCTCQRRSRASASPTPTS